MARKKFYITEDKEGKTKKQIISHYYGYMRSIYHSVNIDLEKIEKLQSNRRYSCSIISHCKKQKIRTKAGLKKPVFCSMVTMY